MSASSRRDFLKNVGVGVPTLKALLAQGAVPAVATSAEAAFDNAKFTPVELNRVLNFSSSDFGPHDLAWRTVPMHQSSGSNLHWLRRTNRHR